MTGFKLGQSTRLNNLAIRVKNRDRMIEFYKMLGFLLKREENELAIFGTSEKDSEILWLEESPRAQAYEGILRKMARMSIVVPTEQEMAEIFSRIKKAQYPIKDALENHGRIGFVLEDPEGNELEIYCSERKEGQRTQAESLKEQQLLDQAQGEQPFFSAGVRFDKVHLNVTDLAKQQSFLEEVLGLTVKDEASGLLVLNEGRFHVGLQEATSQVIALPTNDVHGLDFIKVVIDQASFDKLLAHLSELQEDYFLDGKKRILAIYDTIGVEWWFVLEN